MDAYLKNPVVTKHYSTGTYVGQMQGDAFHGHGKFTFSEESGFGGDYYEGNYVNDKKTGKGIYVSAKGWSYEGDWVDGSFEGYGIYRFPDGSVYEGEWKNDQRHGKGKYTFADGSYYTGEWKNGENIRASKTVKPAVEASKATGTKTVHHSYDSGATYDGEVLNGKRHGHGIYRWADGDRYEGEFVNNQRTGYGKFERYSNSQQTAPFCDLIYEGQWKDGEKHGKGVEKHYMPGVNQDVTVYEGEWVNGKREGIFVWYLFYPATGKESSKDMQYYQNGKVVIESIPYDASIKTYEDFAAAKAKLDAAAKERKRREAAAKASKVSVVNGRSSKINYPIMQPRFLSVDPNKIIWDKTDDALSGYGWYDDADGGQYWGTFKKGKLNGFAQYKFADGAWYTGEFYDNMFHGVGVYYDGKHYHFGKFENGICVTEQYFVEKVERSFVQQNTDGGKIYYNEKANVLIHCGEVISMIENAGTSSEWKCELHGEGAMMAMGKGQGQGVTDSNGIILFPNPYEQQGVMLITGNIFRNGPNGKVITKTVDGTVSECIQTSNGVETLSTTDWAGRILD